MASLHFPRRSPGRSPLRSRLGGTRALALGAAAALVLAAGTAAVTAAAVTTATPPRVSTAGFPSGGSNPGIFTDTCDPISVPARARYWAEKAAKMPADGVVIAKEAFRLVEQSLAYQGEEVASYLFHAYGTNLQFGPGEFNFVKTRAQHGTKEAFRLRDEHSYVPEP